MLFADGVMNIVDVDSDASLEYLYILDFERGLMALNIKDLNNIVRRPAIASMPPCCRSRSPTPGSSTTSAAPS